MHLQKLRQRLGEASATAAERLASLHTEESPDLGTATCVVENIIEAAAARVILDLDREGRRRARFDAVAELEPHLCGACVDLLGPRPEDFLEEAAEPSEEPGEVELEERALFLKWSGEVSRLEPGGDPGDPENPRGALVLELHASVASRSPIGIAESLYVAINSLHIGEDKEAVLVLEDLAAAELEAAKLEKGEAALGAILTLVEPDLDKEEVREIIADWTLAELEQVRQWADAGFEAQAQAAVGVMPALVPTPAVIVALARDLIDTGEEGSP